MGIAGRIGERFLHSPITPLLALVGLLLGIFSVIITPKEEEEDYNNDKINLLTRLSYEVSINKFHDIIHSKCLQ